MKTVSLELAKQLKEAGYPEEGSYAWYVERHYIGNFNGENPRIECIAADMFNKNLHQEISDTWVANAPTADEILDQIGAGYILGKAMTKGYYCSTSLVNEIKPTFYADTLADAAAKMWLYLKKEGLLTSDNGQFKT